MMLQQHLNIFPLAIPVQIARDSAKLLNLQIAKLTN